MIRIRILFKIAFMLTTAMLLVSSQTVVAQDNIQLKKSGRGSTVLGEITGASATKIVIASNGRTREIPVNEIRRVTLAGEPGELRSARSAIIRGQVEQGLSELKQIKADDRDTKLIKQELEFYRVYAQALQSLQGSGDLNEAGRDLFQFAQKNKDSFHYYESVKLLGDLFKAVGKFDQASKYYGVYRKAPFPEYELIGLILEANAFKDNGDFKNAQERFDAVIKHGLNDKNAVRQKTLAKIGKASCMAAVGDEDAVKILDQVIQENDAADAELFANAYNALGTVHAKANRPVDAVLAFLRVDCLYYGEREAHAEALFHLSKLWIDLNKRERADQARKLLNDRYGGTVWAKRS